MRERFMFYENFKGVADKLPDDMRLKFYDALLAYVFEAKEPDDVIIAALITAIKPSLDKEDSRGGNHNPTGQNQYSEVKSGQSGQRGQKRSKEVKNNFEQVKSGQRGQSFLETETGNGNKEKDNLKVIQKEKTKIFQKPTFEEVNAYCQERNNGVDVARWFDYYTANGWKVGKNPMKDWRAAVRTWEKGSVAAPASRKTADDDFYAKLNALGASND
ncbi:MAG: DUF6291 domain-containing protein [Cyanobacteriota bacterium]|nr:DUF6291 domain-containing protein [Cyanobacteriota bacterium]